MSYNRQDLIVLLRTHGVAPTHQRLEIAHVLFGRGEHLSADRILALVNERHAETSKATVYNTLNLFRDRGLIREVIVDPKRVFYDPKKRDSYGIKELGARSEMDVWAFMRHQLKIHPERYRTYVELEAVVCVKRFISLQYLGHQPLQITVYRES